MSWKEIGKIVAFVLAMVAVVLLVFFGIVAISTWASDRSAASFNKHMCEVQAQRESK